MQSKTLLILLMFTLNLFAVEGKMRVKLEAHENLYTSQKVIVSVELLTDAFSISDAKITFPASSKYIVSAPDSAAYIRTEDINGTDWQVVHYEYEVYALKAGEIKLSSVKSVFSASMGYGQPKKEFALESRPLNFSVLTPKGIKKDKFVLVTDNYSLSQKVEPKKFELIVGDAIEVEIIQKAHGVPDILLAPIHYKSTPLLRVYEKEPLLQSGMKGKFDVSRTDKFTFVATAEGNTSIPEYRAVWWDITTKKVHKESLPAMTFRIIADPQIALDAQKAKEKRWMLYAGIFIVVLLLAYKILSPYYYQYRSRKKAQYKESEAGRFQSLLETSKTSNLAKLYHDFYYWLEAADPELERAGFRGIGEIQPSFSPALSQLEKVLADPQQIFDKIDFIDELKKFREVLFKQHQVRQKGLIETINPT